jgi:glycosyltransferase involved in cell wall biosynthesis
VRVVHVHRIGGIGGSERHLLTLLPALAARGIGVSFAGLDLRGDGPEPFYRELAASGIEYERFPCPGDLHPSLPVRLARTARRADLLHTHLVHADVYGALVPGKPLVSTKHNDDPFKAGRFKPVERLLVARARRVIAISAALKRYAVERVGLPERKIDVVHYVLDELPQPWGENPDLGLPDGARLLLAVGRLAEQKGIDVLIRALPAIRQRHPGAVVLVLGEGPERAALEALADELGLRDAVFLPGRVGDVAALYGAAEVVVHPVRWEGFGLALLEAMLAARPVVASAVSAAPEIVEDGRTGLLVPPDDPAALAEAVGGLLDDPARAAAFGAAAAERARAEFSVARMADRTLEVYDRALGRT